MITRTFSRQASNEDGSTGWVMVGAPSTHVPVQGMGVAHDILEHHKNDKGTVEEELQALGAIYYIRGLGGYFGFKTDSFLSHEICNELGQKYEGVLDGIRQTKKRNPVNEEVERWIAGDVIKAREDFRLDFLEHNPEFEEQVEDYLAKVPDWMRLGFSKAKARYSRLDSYTVSLLFRDVAEQVDKLGKEADEYEYDLNLRLKVQINIRRCEVKCSTFYRR